MIPYGKQTINQNDIDSVLNVLNENEMLTTGKYVPEFEKKISEYIGINYALAVNSGTAALHLATFALDIRDDDEVIVPAISFVASSNCVLYQGCKSVFCDINPETLCIDYKKIESLITPKTKAIVIVDMCGQPCDYDEIKEITDKYRLKIIHDAAHSIGAEYKGKKVGSYADITCFSFHPVKNITTCEGGMMVTNNQEYYNRAKAFRTHGISRDFKEREKQNSHYYDMQHLGFNYRIPDLLCALGISQLTQLDEFVKRRNEIANMYDELFIELKEYLTPLSKKYYSAYHIYIIKININKINRDDLFLHLKKNNIGANVHYMPIYMHSYYLRLGYKKGLCPISELIYEQIITLPIFPLLKNDDIYIVKDTIKKYCLNL